MYKCVFQCQLTITPDFLQSLGMIHRAVKGLSETLLAAKAGHQTQFPLLKSLSWAGPWAFSRQIDFVERWFPVGFYTDNDFIVWSVRAKFNATKWVLKSMEARSAIFATGMNRKSVRRACYLFQQVTNIFNYSIRTGVLMAVLFAPTQAPVFTIASIRLH